MFRYEECAIPPILEGLGDQVLKVVLDGDLETGTPRKWAEWLQVPLEHALRLGELDLAAKLVEAGASIKAGRATPIS